MAHSSGYVAIGRYDPSQPLLPSPSSCSLSLSLSLSPDFYDQPPQLMSQDDAQRTPSGSQLDTSHLTPSWPPASIESPVLSDDECDVYPTVDDHNDYKAPVKPTERLGDTVKRSYVNAQSDTDDSSGDDDDVVVVSVKEAPKKCFRERIILPTPSRDRKRSLPNWMRKRKSFKRQQRKRNRLKRHQALAIF